MANKIKIIVIGKDNLQRSSAITRMNTNHYDKVEGMTREEYVINSVFDKEHHICIATKNVLFTFSEDRLFTRKQRRVMNKRLEKFIIK